MKLITERSSRAPIPLYTVNRVPAILAALSKSRMSRSWPTSQWAFFSKSKSRGSPHFRTSTFSLSSLPTGTAGFGVFGIKRRVFRISSSMTASSPSSFLISSESCFISAIRAVVSFPSFFIVGMALESTFCLFFICSTVDRMLRRFSSSSGILSML